MAASACPSPLDCPACGKRLRHHLRGALEAIPAARRRAVVEEMLEALELFEAFLRHADPARPTP